MAQAHSFYMTAKFFYEGITNFEAQGNCKNLVKHFKTLFRIFALFHLTKIGAPLALSKYLTPQHFRQIQQQLLSEYKLIRP